MKSAQAKPARAVRKKPATPKCAEPAELEDDEFDRTLNRALEAGAFDEMIAQAVRDYRDGKTTLVRDRYKKTKSA